MIEPGRISTHRVEALTFLRFVAAIIVVIFHFGSQTSLAQLAPGFLTAGPQMVSFFFVLSGFVLMLAYAGRAAQERLAMRFWWARVARIVPLYLLALALSLWQFWDQPKTGPLALGLDLLFLQAWFPPYPLAINGPAWSLSVEAFFYLSFPLWLGLMMRASASALALLGWALLAWLFSILVLSNLLQPEFYQGFPSISFDLIHFLPLAHLPSFWIGMAGAWWLLSQGQHLKRPGMGPSIIMLVLAAALVFLSLNLKDSYASLSGFSAPLHASFFAPAFLALILVIALANSRATAWLSARPLVLLGEASYALYLLQQPLQRLFDLYLAPYLPLSTDGRFFAFLASLILISVAVYKLFERPLQGWIRRISPLTSTSRMQRVPSSDN